LLPSQEKELLLLLSWLDEVLALFNRQPDMRFSNSLIINANIVIGNTDPHDHAKVKLILRLRLVVTVGEALAHLSF
jgi:hypothetical protein